MREEMVIAHRDRSSVPAVAFSKRAVWFAARVHPVA